MRVAAVSSEGPASPSFRVRAVLPAPALERHGVELAPRPLVSGGAAARLMQGGLTAKAAVALAAHPRVSSRLRRDVAACDVLLVHRRVDPFPGLGLEKLARDASRLVYDVDDAIWLEDPPLGTLKGSARKARWLAEQADHTIAGNEVLAEHLSRHTRELSVVPSMVDTDAVGQREHADAPELVLGWIGSHSTAPFMARLDGVVRRVAGELGGVRLRLLMVGGAEHVAGVATEARPWSAEAQDDALRRMDVGVMPLPDTAWARGKCAYKALQYMAAGVPVVADDVGIAAAVLGQGRAGYAVRGEEAWVEALLALARDRALRAELGAEGRRRVEREYSVKRWTPELARILRGA